MNMRVITCIASTFTVFAVLTGPVKAQSYSLLTLSLAQPAQTVAPGGNLFFSGTLSDLNQSILYFGGDSLNQIGSWPAGLVANDASFLTNAPATLTSSTPYKGDLFNVSVDHNTPAGTYNGTFQVEYDDTSGNPFFASQGFQVVVAPNVVPESSSIVSFGLLLALGAVLIACKRKKMRADV